MANAERVVVRRTLHDPIADEFFQRAVENGARVRVAGRRDRAFLGISFANDKFKFSVRILGQAEHRDRAFFQFELDGSAVARLAVVFCEAAQHRAAFCNPQMVRAVVPNKDTIGIKMILIKGTIP